MQSFGRIFREGKQAEGRTGSQANRLTDCLTGLLYACYRRVIVLFVL